ncbi:hypothetical protein GCM10007860_32610 [Chitiniphilus shinanonensis]|uniref:Twin-arginine translocation pathway signal n=1 Tax=Chitiniphilus shinanonensis TaxID=553088 RepID=A0ABQ6BY63_9NEIS|nr:DUF1513 domain-containing protein [Chitiniphilus shinanonensis]GLS06095.1 hypothetical protein GCM10007860_32610 [Chitiniphilus shinanonensis]
MNLSRRHFLVALGVLALPLPALAGLPRRTLLAAAADDGGPFFEAVNGGAPLRLPTRGHGMLPIPGSDELILVARRAGFWLARVDWRRGVEVQRIAPAPGRHFYGHAILSPDGATLYTTENDIEHGAGVVGVYDAATLTRRGEFSSHGIGPHELYWLVPGRTLAVANGGILTLPQSGRDKLNLASMAPSVAIFDLPSGTLLSSHALSDNTLSLRHLARTADGTLGIAIQAESPDGRDVMDTPLLAVLRDGRLTLAEHLPGWGGYAASVAAVGDVFVATALQGDVILLWRSDGSFLGEVGLQRPAGIAVDGERVYVSNEMGLIAELDVARRRLTPLATRAGVKWDNHLVVV